MPVLANIPLADALAFVAAILYVVGTIVFLPTFTRERSELTAAVLAFFASMAAGLSLLGAADLLDVPILAYLGAFSIITGACVMLRLPFTVLPQPLRPLAFYVSLAVSWLLLSWLVGTPDGRNLLLPATMAYMMVINGGITGGYLFSIGLRSRLPSVRVKAIGSGAGIASCCIGAHLATIAGAPAVVAATFQLAAPLVLLTALFAGRAMQRGTAALPPPSRR
ncbi:MAG: hypothetical protein Q7S23_05485 [bacterium]|nr:hypothetical protein [bacterium]